MLRGLALSTLVGAVVSTAGAPAAGAAGRCGSVDLPYTDAVAAVRVTTGSLGCRTARSLVVATWSRTLFPEPRRTVAVTRGGRTYRCLIGSIRTTMVCSHRSGGALRIRVRATV